MQGRVLALCHSAPGGALILSVYMHTGAGLTQENWQILSTIGHLAHFPQTPAVHRRDWSPMQLEDSGLVLSVASVWRRSSPRSRRRIGSSISSLSSETSALHCCVHAAHSA